MKKNTDVGMEKGSLKCEKCGGKFAARVDGMCIDCNDKEKLKQLKEDKDWEMINDMKSEPSIIAYMERHGK